MQHAFADVFAIAFPVILGVETEYCRAEPVIKRNQEIEQFAACAEAVLRGCSVDHYSVGFDVEFHYYALHDDNAYRENGKLQSERQPLFKVSPQRFEPRFEILFFQSERFVFYHGIRKASDHA